MDKDINRIKVVYQRLSASDGDVYKDCEAVKYYNRGINKQRIC